MTQVEVARWFGVRQERISQIERGAVRALWRQSVSPAFRRRRMAHVFATILGVRR
jgi:DNA-binding XRE family transcriptional regulator